MEQHLYGKPDQKRKAQWNLFLEIFSVKTAWEQFSFLTQNSIVHFKKRLVHQLFM